MSRFSSSSTNAPSSTLHHHRPSSTPPEHTHHHQPSRSRSHLYLLYIAIPLLTALTWLSTLTALLLTYLLSHRPHYSSMSPGQRIAYISDVGADRLKPLFVAGGAVTGVGFVAGLGVERWLRHEGRLLPNTTTREKLFSTLAILGALLGGVALILLSVFDTKRHMTLHRVFLLFFVLGVALSAIFTVIEYRILTRVHSPNSHSNTTRYPPRVLRALYYSYILKASLTLILIALAIAFGILLRTGSSSSSGDSENGDTTTNKSQDAAAILEWSISYGFTLYVVSFAWDLGMSRGVGRGEYKEGYGTYGNGEKSGRGVRSV